MIRAPFYLQAAAKKAVPSLSGLYRRFRSWWHQPRSYYAGAPMRFVGLVEQIRDTPFPRLREERFNREVRRDPADPANINNVVLEINNTCNIDCLMCMTSLSTRKKGRMTPEMLELAAGKTAEFGAHEVELHTIGDPLANPRLADVFALLRRHRVRTGITTNALLLHRHVDMLIEFVDVCSSLSFSIDGGTGPTYERIRAGGSWDQLLANLDLARERLAPKGFRIRSSMVVGRDNVHEVGLYIERLRDYVTHPPLDIEFHFVNSLAPDNAYFDSANLFPAHTYTTPPCSQISSPIPHVFVDGRVTACSRDYDGSLVIGDIHQNSLAEIVRGEPMRRLQQAHATGDVSTYSLCRTCFMVDSRIGEAFNELTHYLLYFHPREGAGFYQERVDECIAMFQGGVDPAAAARLFPRPRPHRHVVN